MLFPFFPSISTLEVQFYRTLSELTMRLKIVEDNVFSCYWTLTGFNAPYPVVRKSKHKLSAVFRSFPISLNAIAFEAEWRCIHRMRVQHLFIIIVELIVVVLFCSQFCIENIIRRLTHMWLKTNFVRGINNDVMICVVCIALSNNCVQA